MSTFCFVINGTNKERAHQIIQELNAGTVIFFLQKKLGLDLQWSAGWLVKEEDELKIKKM